MIEKTAKSTDTRSLTKPISSTDNDNLEILTNRKQGNGDIYIDTKNRKTLVVFDIDETICCAYEGYLVFEAQKRKCLQCDGYYFIPYIKHLIKYLLCQNNTRIAFFSAGEAVRNIPLICKFLCAILGAERYNSLVLEGQFEVFSRHHQSKVWDHKSKEFIDSQKDLNLVLKPGETINDAILVDDRSGSAHADHPVFIQTPHVVYYGTEYDERWRNNSAYFLGIFKVYYESLIYSSMTLRECITQLIPISEYSKPALAFQKQMIELGLSEIRKTHSFAACYNSELYDIDMREQLLFEAKYHLWTNDEKEKVSKC